VQTFIIELKERAPALSFLAKIAVMVTLMGCSIEPRVDEVSVEENGPFKTSISSLSDLSIEAFRNRQFGSEIIIESKIEVACAIPTTNRSIPEAVGTYQSYMASYKSDGLRVYTRINIPDGPEPEGGFPVIIFAHGWVGAEAAPSYTLGCDPASMYSEVTDAYARAGFMVFVPGYRGHATVDGVVGQGNDFIKVWDNGTYLSTILYAVDVMNLMAGIQSSGTIENDLLPQQVSFKTDALNLSGHSQGGDVALTVLAATGEGAANGLSIKKASIWSGGFADRLTLMRTYHPLEQAPESFMSGDGNWTGTAVGDSGAVNPNFIFAYPPAWIETVDTQAWSWQKDTWKFPTVKAVLDDSFAKTYQTLNDYVEDISGATYALTQDDTGKVIDQHDAVVALAMGAIGGFNDSHYLREPLSLHFSDRDHISLPAWNYDLCERVNTAGGACVPFEYPENDHGMRVSKHKWFSSENAVEGYATMVARDVRFFNGDDPATVSFLGGN
jgi:dienelactone hydrolase